MPPTRFTTLELRALLMAATLANMEPATWQFEKDGEALGDACDSALDKLRAKLEKRQSPKTARLPPLSDTP